MTTRGIVQVLLREKLLLVFAVLALVLALFDPHSWADHQRWLQIPTLAGLLGLILCIQAVCDSGLVQHAAAVLVMRVRGTRQLGLVLVAITAALSMVLTNDVSLFLVVPLTVAIGRLSNLPTMRLVVLEALAVNAGSTLSPIGNPQNLLLWQHGHMAFFDFVRALLPAFAVMSTLLVLLTLAWLPGTPVELQNGTLDRHRASTAKAIRALLFLAAMVVAMEYGHAPIGALLLLVWFVLMERDTLRRIDWLLIATFAAIFLGLGHFAEWAPVHRALDGLNLQQPATLYTSGIVLSQLISNVPATVLLLNHAPSAVALAVAVNVGGFGLAIGSLANLIALRLAQQPGGGWLLHKVSVPFLLVCAPLVYAATRWLC